MHDQSSIVKFTTCGIEGSAQKKYLNKLKNLNYKLVSNSDEYDYIIMNNRIIFNQQKETVKKETCFDRFRGEEILKIKSRNLVISKIVQNTQTK